MSSSDECKIHLDPAIAAGQYANAFRLVRDGEQEWFIDFLIISHTERAGRLVSRTRVSLEMLVSLQETLTETLEDLGVLEADDDVPALLGHSRLPN